MRSKHICFFVPYPLDESPSQRFRLEHYVPVLQTKGFEVTFLPFLKQSSFKFRTENSFLAKLFAFTKASFLRPFQLWQARNADFIFIHREATPFGPPFIEYIIAKILKKKIIYDFDDAIWLTDKPRESPLAKLLRCRWKIRFICRWSFKISCGNPYLANYASQFNPNVIVNPTTIDIANLHKPSPTNRDPEENVTVGWTGSHSTLKYLNTIVPVLQVFERKYPHVRYLIIADQDPKLPLANAVFLPWKKETEIADLAKMDIGIMPLPDDAWTRGKCGFKALQYMAMEIPAVISPVGINQEIVKDEVEGYWCTTFEEWFNRLEKLIQDPEQRARMGKRGRQKVIDCYSVTANSDNFLSLFQ